jgi:hypothetical protein
MTVWLYDRPKMLSEFAHEILRRCRQPLRVGRFLQESLPVASGTVASGDGLLAQRLLQGFVQE